MSACCGVGADLPVPPPDPQIILHKTIESVLERGARLDDLVAKSHDLSMASQLFYRQARKSNSCCQLM